MRMTQKLLCHKKAWPTPVMKSTSLGCSVLTPGSSTSRETSFYHLAAQSPLCQQLFTVPLKLGRDYPKSHTVHLPQTCSLFTSWDSSLSLPYGMPQFWWNCCITAYKPQYIIITVFSSIKNLYPLVISHFQLPLTSLERFYNLKIIPFNKKFSANFVILGIETPKRFTQFKIAQRYSVWCLL